MEVQDTLTNEFQLLSRSEKDTARIAQAIAPFFRFGDLIILGGDLASGKTLFVKAFAEARGSEDDVTSPTFTIANFYNIEGGYILHTDVYRLSGVNEFRDLGLSDFYDQSIVLMEWGQKVIGEFEEYVLIAFEFVKEQDKHRKLTFSFVGDKWASAQKEIQQKLSNL